MGDPFFDNYYRGAGVALKLAQEEYKSIHRDAGGKIDGRLLSKFDLNDPRRSRATVTAIVGIRHQLDGFQRRLASINEALALAAIQREQFVLDAGLKGGLRAFDTIRDADQSRSDPVYLARKAMNDLGFATVGGDNAPYIWVNTGTDSWAFFDKLLNEAQVVCTPGAGFGKCGEGHVRISAFNSRENVEKALVRIAAALKA